MIKSILSSNFYFIYFLQNNLVRSSMSAIMVAVFDIIRTALGLGWTYVLLAGIVLLMLPLAFLVSRFGPKWRERRRRRTIPRSP